MPSYPVVRSLTINEATTGITIPASTQQGDLIVIEVYGNSQAVDPSMGMTNMPKTGSDQQYSWYKTADATDAGGHTYSFTTNSQYIILVLAGSVFLSGESDNALAVPSLTHPGLSNTSAFVLGGFYGVSDIQEPTGWTVLHENITGNYSTFVMRRDGVPTPTEAQSMTLTTGVNGAKYSSLVIARYPNDPPNAPTNFTHSEPVGNNLPLSWTHSDPDGNPQNSYKFKWRRV